MVQALKKLVFCLLVVCAVAAWQVRADEAAPSPDSDVKILSSANFDKLTSNGDWIIEFYAPWCGHCKQLKPVFEEAAANSVGKLNFGAVDCTTHRDLQDRFNVKSYPTIKFFRDGVARNYKGERNVKAFEAFAEHMSQPSVATVSSLKELKEMSSKVPVTFLYVAPSDDNNKDELFSAFSRVARAMQSSELLFVKGASNAIRNKYTNTNGKKTQGTVVMLTEGDVVAYTGSSKESKLKDWAEQHKLPLVSTIQPGTFEDVTGSGKIVFFAVINPRALSQTKHFIDSVRTVAKRYRQFVFAEIDGVKFSKYVSQFGVAEDAFPAMFALDYPAEIFWTVPEGMEMMSSERAVEHFVSDVASGKIQGRGISSWYNPMKWFKDFEKWLGSFNETQLMYGVGAAMIVFLGILIFACIYAGSDLMDPDQAVRSNKDLDNVPGAVRRKGGKSSPSDAKAKSHEEVKLVEAEEQDPPSNISASQLALRNKKAKSKKDT